MCKYMMTVDMYEMMCKVADYVGINVVRAYTEVLVDVFPMTLMFLDMMEEKFQRNLG